MDYDEIEAFLVGRCGLRAEEAGRLTIREVVLLRRGKERELQEMWEIARWRAYMEMQMSPHFKPHTKAKRVQDFYPFAWEKEEARKKMESEETRMTDEEVKLVTRIFKEYGQDR